MLYLSIRDISKSYGLNLILSRVSLMLYAGQRVGLVGANGVGKSTLLKIITGEVAADGGSVTLTPGMELGYLAQAVSAEQAEMTIVDLIAAAMSRVRQLEARLRDLEQQMTVTTGESLTAIMRDYVDATEKFERWGGYDIEYRVDTVLNGLGVGHLPRDRRFATLSGGEKARVSLALLLVKAPDVLLLDEPSNHLDFAALSWLEDYLRRYQGAILIVSHDRQFLNHTVTAIVEIDEHTHTARHYSGSYDAYHQVKLVERRRWREDYARQQEEIKALRLEVKETARRNDNFRTSTDNDKFIIYKKRMTHQATVARRVHVAEEKLKRIEDDPIPEPPDDLRFDPDFDPQTLRGRMPLIVSQVTKTFGERCVLNRVTFTLDPGGRLMIVGPNGAGKSTLLKILVGQETADSGEVYRNPAVRIGYLDQGYGGLDPAKTVLHAFGEGTTLPEQAQITMLIRSGLFRYAELDRRVGQLSTGQQRKLQIARLIAGKANMLVLDEPTNDVSFDVLEGLEEALRHFPGPVIAASHDRRFIEQFGGEVFQLQDGRLLPFRPEIVPQPV
jgi:macrolide transport system ATP-binding/permease protein